MQSNRPFYQAFLIPLDTKNDVEVSCGYTKVPAHASAKKILRKIFSRTLVANKCGIPSPWDVSAVHITQRNGTDGI